MRFDQRGGAGDLAVLALAVGGEQLVAVGVARRAVRRVGALVAAVASPPGALGAGVHGPLLSPWRELGQSLTDAARGFKLAAPVVALPGDGPANDLSHGRWPQRGAAAGLRRGRGVSRRSLAPCGAAIALLAAAALAAALAVAGCGSPGSESPSAGTASPTSAVTATPAVTTTPTWTPNADQPPPEYDRNYKLGLVEALDEPPELVFMGGSRAQRFEPSYIRKLTGLSAFNFAVQNNRPEDAYAMSQTLFEMAPDVKLRLFYAVQVTTFNDGIMHPGLLYDERFSRWFPDALIAAQKKKLGTPKPDGIPENNHYSPRGCLLYNSYDERLERGRTQERALATYLERLVPKAAAPLGEQSRSRRYFEKLLRLYNDHGVTPAIVLMPQHPVALAAFREVGWQAKNDALLAYLHGLEDEYDLRVLDYTEIESFGGKARYFYDGSHVTKENARLLLDAGGP